jgi:hypothetical protein
MMEQLFKLRELQWMREHTSERTGLYLRDRQRFNALTQIFQIRRTLKNLLNISCKIGWNEPLAARKFRLTLSAWACNSISSDCDLIKVDITYITSILSSGYTL